MHRETQHDSQCLIIADKAGAACAARSAAITAVLVAVKAAAVALLAWSDFQCRTTIDSGLNASA